MCGEQAWTQGLTCILLGSPPRVRGTGKDGCNQGVEERITPACAGNSKAWPASLSNWEDHPRVCGEQIVVSDNGGITWDHPRVCGEQAAVGRYAFGFQGSPPRVRGTE